MQTSSTTHISGWPKTTRLVVAHDWILRNDRDKVVLYLLSHYASAHFLLTSQEGIALALLDGTRTIDQAVALTAYLFSCPREVASAHVMKLIGKLSDWRTYPILRRYPVLRQVPSEQPRRPDLDPGRMVVRQPAVALNRRRLHAPLALLVFFTNRCQADCRYCYAERRRVPRSKGLTLAEWRSILVQAQELEIRQILPSGGDTLARPDGIDFLELLIEHGLLFLVSTKCLVTPEQARRLVDAGFGTPVHGVAREFQISLDSTNRQVAGFLTRRDDYLDRAYASIRNLVGAGVRPKVKAVLTPYNLQDLEGFVRDLSQAGVQRISFSFYDASFYRHADDLSLTEQMKSRLSVELQQLSSRYSELTFDGDAVPKAAAQAGALVGDEPDRSPPEAWTARAACSGGRTVLGVTPDGKAILCEQVPQQAPFLWGDLRKASIGEVWNSPALLEFVFPDRERFRGTVCHSCESFAHCQYEIGNCFRDAYFATGTPFGAPPRCPRASAAAVPPPPRTSSIARSGISPVRSREVVALQGSEEGGHGAGSAGEVAGPLRGGYKEQEVTVVRPTVVTGGFSERCTTERYQPGATAFSPSVGGSGLYSQGWKFSQEGRNNGQR